MAIGSRSETLENLAAFGLSIDHVSAAFHGEVNRRSAVEAWMVKELEKSIQTSSLNEQDHETQEDFRRQETVRA
jgi:hypothetical protein